MGELVPLRVVTTCNTSDTEILANLRASRERGLPYLDVLPLKDKPLLIVGSGPSAREALKDFDLSKVDVMALNGAYRYLIDAGWVADYYAQLDARQVNRNFVDAIHEHTRFYLAAQVHPDVYERLKDSKVTTFHLNTETTKAVFGDAEGAFLGGSGGTVGSTAIALAGVLGYRQIWLLGYDSSFSVADDACHLLHQPQNEGQGVLDVEFNGKFYRTTHSLADQVTSFLNWSNLLHKTFDGMTIDALGEGLFYDYLKCAGEKRPEITTVGEAAKYADMYKMDDYRMPAHRRQAVQDILSAAKGKRLLDVGTGRGETLDMARALGYEIVSGTETVDELISEAKNVGYGLLPNISMPHGYYDVVTCFEVLEHLLPQDVIPAIENLLRISGKDVFVSVCTAPDWVAGVDLHPSATDEIAWELRFLAAGAATIEKIGNFSTRGVSPVYRLTKAVIQKSVAA